MPRSALRYRLILVGAATWHTASSMTMILVPLYADSLGYSALAVGSLVSLPIVAHIGMRLVGGALAERWGEKALLLASFAAMALAGPVYLLASSFLMLLAAQLAPVLSRSVYYVCSQSYVTRAPGAGEFGARLGHLNAANHAGTIAGVVCAGLLVATYGFAVSFMVFTSVAVVALLCGALLPSLPRGGSVRSVASIALSFVELAGRRQMLLCLLCGFGAGLPTSLGQSFYPLFITYLGYGEEVTGIVAAFHSAGAIGQGVLVARLVTLGSHQRFFKLGFLGLGAGLALTPVSGEAAIIALLVALAGFSSGSLDMCYQTLAAFMSTEQTRVTTFAVAGLGWSLAHLVVPVTFGALVELWGYSTAFHGYGLALMALAAITPVVYRLLLTEADRLQVEQTPAA